MSLTLNQMRSMLEDLLSYDLDNYYNRDGHVATSGELTSLINYGLRFVGRKIYTFNPSVVFTPTAEVMQYDTRDLNIFSSKMIEVTGVIINGSPLYAADRYSKGLWHLQEVERSCPTWRTDTSGRPDKAFQLDSSLYLHRMPSQAIIDSGNNFVMGHVMPTDFVDGQDDDVVCTLPEELHEAVVRLAAVFAADPSVSEAEGINRISRYEGRAIQDMSEIRIRNMRLAQSWGTTSGSSFRSRVRF